MGRDENYPSKEAWHCTKKEHWALGAGYMAERKSTASQGSYPSYSEAGTVQLSRWSLALPYIFWSSCHYICFSLVM